MNSFENKMCPLCGKVLTLKLIAGVTVYQCSVNFEFHSHMGIKLRSHYEVESDKSNTYQHMYLLPWAIDNFGDSAKSRLYKIEDEKLTDGTIINKWKLIMQVSQIHSDTEENLRDRINTLVTFL